MQDTQAVHGGKRQSLMPQLLMPSEMSRMESPRFNNEMKYYIIKIKNAPFKCIFE